MPCAVMSNTLNSIMLLLRDAIDSQQNITNMDAVSEAVSSLELFPMTMNQLQDTRIGLILKNIRHKVEPSLQKRIRFVIKAWQQLIKPGSAAAEIIPKPNISPLNNSQSVNSISDNGNHKVDDALNKINSSDSSLSRTQSLGSSRKRPRQNLNSPNVDLTNHTQNNTKSKIPRIQNEIPSNNKHSKSSVSLLNSISSPVTQNGQRSVSGNYSNAKRPMSVESDKSNSHKSDTVNVVSKEVTKLTKVKSTAELLQTAGHCLDSATLNKILSNKIHKEVDEPKSLVSGLTKQAPKKIAKPSVPLKGSEPFLDNNSQSNEKDGKNEVMAKFLASTVDSESCTEPVQEILNSRQNAPINSVKPEVDKKIKSSSEDPDDSKKKHKKHKKKSKHKDEKYITNRMDEWPTLPPIPEDIDWESLEKDTVNDELNAVRDDLTGMRTVTVCEQLMHVLPWVDTFGEKKQFFPVDSEQPLDDLLESIPEPW